MALRVESPFSPRGDQPQAIAELVEGLGDGLRFQTLLGATGTGKTFTMAKIIEAAQRPALILAPNKILTAQLAAEFRDFFPGAAVEFSSPTTTTTSPKRTSPRATSSSKKTPTSTRSWSGCATPRPATS